jgi:spermidine/putrescine transport system substrate-binding protein
MALISVLKLHEQASGIILISLIILNLLSACGSATLSPTTTPPQAKELILRNWEGDISQEILDAFQAEYGIPVRYLPYESQEEAIADMHAGQVYDVVVLENQLIPALVAEGMLAEIDYRNVPNFKNISANFRDLAYDPRNTHAIPYSWGTTALVVRTDLVEAPITRWADLWDPRYAGKLMGWPLSRYMLGIALKSLGYSLNSENPEEVEAALQKLISLKPYITLREWEPAVAAPYLVSGEVVIAVGQADDVTEGQKANPAIRYVLPQEGAILWGDNFTIPAGSPNKEAAEKLIDFLLRADIAAQIVNETYYWLPNDAALPLVKEEIRTNPAIFPSSDLLKNAEIVLPLSPEGEALHAAAWERFLAAGQ